MNKLRLLLLPSLLLSISVFSQSFVGAGKAVDPYHYISEKDQTFSQGAVACAHPIAARVGAEILKRGGNAFDAAIAVQLALAVVYPGAGNIGGGGFSVARTQKGKTLALDFRETAPAKASRNMYVNDSGVAQTNLSQLGHLASGIPGTVKGLFETMKYARLSFATLIEPAIALADNGFTLTQAEATKFNKAQEAFRKANTVVPVFVKATEWKEGDTLVQHDLANTLRRIRDNGAAGFYEGETARLILAEMQRGKGIITADDLKQYQPKQRSALQFGYKGNTIVTMPPPSSGGVLLCQMLKMVQKYPLAAYGFETAKSVHLMAEAERRAFADRAVHLGDPDFWNVKLQTLTSDKYVQMRMKTFDSTKASKSSEVTAGVIEQIETTHISIVDKWGNVVSVTTTLNGTFGSKTVVGGAGFLLNNEMDDFSAKPGVPNMYGAVGGEANAIAPGKRMLSSMTPTIVLKGNKPFLVLGTPGGTTIPTSVFQTIVDVMDFDMSLPDAVNKPKFHHQWLPDEIQVEQDFPKDVTAQLQSMGYTVKPYFVAGYATTIGRVEAIKIAGGKLQTVADTRGDDCVAGY